MEAYDAIPDPLVGRGGGRGCPVPILHLTDRRLLRLSLAPNPGDAPISIHLIVNGTTGT